MEQDTIPTLNSPDFNSMFVNSGIIADIGEVDFFIDPQYVLLALSVVFLIFLIISLVMVYHWITYGYKPRAVLIAAFVYFGVSFILGSIMFVTYLSYSSLV